MTESKPYPYILWINYGSEGWKPDYFNTLREALLAPKFGSEFVITKQINWIAQEIPLDAMVSHR
jgi:hypothetical protein